MSALPKTCYTLEEYLELDRESDERLEYWDGEIFSMSGASDSHYQIEVNLIAALNPRLSKQGCRSFTGNTRIKVPSKPPYRYGDAAALCGTAKFEKISVVDVLVNPALIIEILSTSTEAIDRGDKFTNYQSISSFSEYVLIAQHRPHVTQLVKQPDNTWLLREFNSLDDCLHLKSVNCEMTLREIYEGVTFPPPTPYLVMPPFPQ